MHVLALTILICFGLATTAAAQGSASGKSSSSSASSKGQLSEVRSIVHELQARSEKLRELMSEYRSFVENRPAKSSDEQFEKWEAAHDRLLKRIVSAHAAVVETKQQLDKAATGNLPTGLAKDVANATNEAEAQRTAAEQTLAKNKPSAKKPAKKTEAEKPAPPIPDDL